METDSEIIIKLQNFVDRVSKYMKNLANYSENPAKSLGELKSKIAEFRKNLGIHQTDWKYFNDCLLGTEYDGYDRASIEVVLGKVKQDLSNAGTFLSIVETEFSRTVKNMGIRLQKFEKWTKVYFIAMYAALVVGWGATAWVGYKSFQTYGNLSDIGKKIETTHSTVLQNQLSRMAKDGIKQDYMLKYIESADSLGVSNPQLAELNKLRQETSNMRIQMVRAMVLPPLLATIMTVFTFWAKRKTRKTIQKQKTELKQIGG